MFPLGMKVSVCGLCGERVALRWVFRRCLRFDVGFA